MEDFFLKTLLGVTKPFRTGANLLAQGYGDLYRGLSGKTDYVSPFEKYIREGVTQEEQQNIEQKPYLEILKSGAGMASTLAPVASQGLRSVQYAAKPLLNRTAQLASQGGFEGLLGGFGYSRDGKELQDTLTGGALGVVGELLGGYLMDPQYRGLVNKGVGDMNTGSYPAYVQLRDGTQISDQLGDLRAKAYMSAGISDTPTNTTQMTTQRALDSLQDDIEVLSNAVQTPEGLRYLNALKEAYGEQLGNTLDMPLRYYKPQGDVLGASEYVAYQDNPNILYRDGERPTTIIGGYQEPLEDNVIDLYIPGQNEVAGRTPPQYSQMGDIEDLLSELIEEYRRRGVIK